MNIKLLIFIAFVLVIGITSCKKEVDDAPATPATTDLNVINGTADTLNFYLNGARVNNLSSLYPLGSSGYSGVSVGEQVYQFKKYRSPIVLFDLPLAIDTNTTYSVFIGGLSADQSFSVKDTLVADTGGRPVVRFVNASPDAGNLTVLVGDTVNFKVRAFKTATVFLPVNAGTKRVRIYQSGSTTPLIDEKRIMTAGRIYTLFSKGALKGGGDGGFGTGLVVNR